MRTTRILLAALSVALVAACTSEPVGVVRSATEPALYGAGWNGSGNSIVTDTTVIAPLERGAGWNGSGN